MACAVLFAQSAATGPVPLVYSGTPLRIPFECERERLEDLGLVCLEDQPCLVFTEFAAVYSKDSKIVLAGNFHSQASTMESLLLQSDDGGVTWTEPYTRVRMGSFEHILFLNAEAGWISGHIVQSLARDPFVVNTKDSGKTWRRRPLFSESTVATMEGFQFNTPLTGEAVVTVEGRSQRWRTTNGGDTWQLSETSTTKMTPPVMAPPNPDWRIRSDAKLKSHVLERRQNNRFAPVAAFQIEAASCVAQP